MDTSRSQPARSKATSKVETRLMRKREEISDHNTDIHHETASESTPEESSVPPRTSSRGLSATELQAEFAQLGMDMRGTKFKEAIVILQQWQVNV